MQKEVYNSNSSINVNKNSDKRIIDSSLKNTKLNIYLIVFFVLLTTIICSFFGIKNVNAASVAGAKSTNFYVNKSGKSGSIQFHSIMNYSTSSTATTYTITVSSLQIYSDAGSGISNTSPPYAYSIVMKGTTKASGTKNFSSVNMNTGQTNTVWSGTATITITKTHAAQSIVISGTATYKGDGLSNSNNSNETYYSKAQTTITVPAKTSYTVSYNGNGGTAPSSQTKWYGEALTLRGAITRTGYTFSKWKATNGTLYSASGSYTANAATTMTAQWTEKTAVLTYNANGHGTAPAKVTMKYTTATKAASAITGVTGYTFKNWNTAANGSGTAYAAGATVKAANVVPTAKTLYAQWTANKYTLTANANGGSIPSTTGWTGTGSTATKSVTYNTAYGTLPTPTRSGYAFDGWYTAASGGTKVTASTKIGAAATTIYAHWVSTANYANWNGVTTQACSSCTANIGYNTGSFYIHLAKEGVRYASDLVTVTPKTTGTNASAALYTTHLCTGASTCAQRWKFSNSSTANVQVGASATTEYMGYKISLGGGSSSSFIYAEPTLKILVPKGYKYSSWNVPYNDSVFTGNSLLHDYNTNTVHTAGTSNVRLFAAAAGKQGPYASNTWVNGYLGLNIASAGFFTRQGTVGSNTGYYRTLQSANVNFVPNTTTINFNANTGSGTMTSQTHTYDDALTLNLNQFTKEDNIFTGWNTSSDGTGTKYSDGGTIGATSYPTGNSATLYAQWYYGKAIGTSGGCAWKIDHDGKMTIYPEGGGTCTLGSATNIDGTYQMPWYDYSEEVTSVEVDSGVTIELDNASYVFSGLSNATSIDLSNVSFNQSDNFNGNYMFYNCESLTDLDLGSLEVEANIDNVYDYMFEGCSSLESLDLTIFDMSEGYSSIEMFKDCTSLTSLTFNSGSLWGFDNTSSMFENCSSLVNIDASNLAPNEVGTMTNMFKDCSSLETLDLSNFHMDNVSSYDGLIDGVGTDKAIGTKLVLNDTFDDVYSTSSAYIFPYEYYVKEESGSLSNTLYTLSDMQTEVTGSATSTTWVPAYSVTYDKNNGDSVSGTPNPDIYRIGTNVDTTGYNATKTDYRLSNWNTESDDSGETFEKNTETNISYGSNYSSSDLTNGNITLYAQFEEDKYTVDVLVVNGEGSDSKKIDSGSSETFIVESDTGYGNGVVSCTNSQTGSLSGTTLTVSNVTNNTECTVTYSANSYTIIFNNNGGTGSMSNLSMTYDEAKNLTKNTFTKANYTFSGWNTEANGTGTSYSDEESVENLATSGEITLYAQWTGNDYTIAFNSNGGTGSMESIEAIYGTPITLPANGFLKKGYTFNGWNTEANGTGTSYNDEQEVTNVATSGTKTLYAQWLKHEITMKYNDNNDPLEKISDNYQYYNELIQKNSFIILKVDNVSNDPLQSAVFTLTGTSTYGNSVSETATSLANGEATFSNIEYGTYTLRETTQPTDYKPNSTTYSVTVGSTVTITGITPSNGKFPIENELSRNYNDLKVENKVLGNMGDINKDFSYSVSFTGLDASKTYTIEGTPNSFTTNASGAATVNFTLKHNGSITFKNIPSGAKYTVTQSGSEYIPTYNLVSDGSKGSPVFVKQTDTGTKNNSLSTSEETVDMTDGNVTVKYSNTYESQIDTGVSADHKVPLAAIFTIVLLIIYGIVMLNIKKSDIKKNA